MNKSLYIAVDFDGTCVTHSYPEVGTDIGAVPVLKKLVEGGHKLILFTMRSGKELADAVNWFKENDIELYGVQYNPTQASWTESNKCYAQIYIDDAAFGAPLVWNKHTRPYIDWVAVENYFFNNVKLNKSVKNITVKEAIDLLQTQDPNAVVCRMESESADGGVFYSSIELIKTVSNVDYIDDGGDMKNGNVVALY